MDAGGQALQFGLLDVELVRDGQEERLADVLAESLQVLLGAGPPPEAEHLEQDDLPGLLVDEAKVRHPEAAAEREYLGLLHQFPVLDALAERLDKQAQLR